MIACGERITNILYTFGAAKPSYGSYPEGSACRLNCRRHPGLTCRAVHGTHTGRFIPLSASRRDDYTSERDLMAAWGENCVPAEGTRDDDVTRDDVDKTRTVPGGAADTASKPQSRLKRLLAFFDSTTKVFLAVGGLIAAIVALWTAISNLAQPTKPPAATVPYVVGMTLPTAASALKEDGFDNIPYLYGCYGSPDIQDVVRQVPGSGALIARSAPVHLYLQAKDCGTVPNVVGMNLSGATDALHGAGFSQISSVSGCYGSSEIGAVVTQSPTARTSYGKHQAVSLKLQADRC